MKTKWVVISVIVAVVLLGLAFYFITRDNVDKHNQLSDYSPGEIFVGFKDNVTIEDAKALVTSKGLSFDERITNWESARYFIVYVPEGKEEEWINNFETEQIVQDAEFLYLEYNI